MTAQKRGQRATAMTLGTLAENKNRLRPDGNTSQPRHKKPTTCEGGSPATCTDREDEMNDRGARNRREHPL
eukprot:scaffold18906_cov122-Isochrysis_galbana.AAC.5